MTFDKLRDYGSWHFPWLQCDGPGIMASLKKAVQYLRPEAMKIIVLNLNAVPFSNGKHAERSPLVPSDAICRREILSEANIRDGGP
jgi:hypothetical protein